ncbi:unnamed protein product [Mytilus coruscus]|uniref:Uncharacterized protein n=1 Tax=Mytilus coruscus TaxID=42192 RepID=A0A6J8E5K5_MYTCO|nr:unnamed protein product [Mytilus coruscus]
MGPKKWLRKKIENTFFEIINFHVINRNGYIEKSKGTLLPRKGADLARMLHDRCWQRRTSKREQESSLLDNSIRSDTDSSLSNGYHKVIFYISKRYQNQAKIFKQCFENADLSKINFMSISKSIDPFLWNFHFLVSQSKNEWNTLNSFPCLGVPYFEEKKSCHHNSRVLRTLFSVCHTIYQVSNGECANPLHHNSRVLRTLFSICHTIYQVSNGECANPLHHNSRVLF